MDYHTLVRHPSFPSYLGKIDADIAQFYDEQGCGKCHGPLDRSDYFRSTGFGITEASDKEARRRHSLCCRVDGCRSRVTPPSLRFAKGKWFLSVVIVLMTAMQHGITAERRTELQKQLGISRQTIDRWRKWWRETFVASPMWHIWRSRCPLANGAALPDALLLHFQASAKTPCHALALLCALIGSCRIADPTPVFKIVQGRLERGDFAQYTCGENRQSNE